MKGLCMFFQSKLNYIADLIHSILPFLLLDSPSMKIGRNQAHPTHPPSNSFKIRIKQQTGHSREKSSLPHPSAVNDSRKEICLRRNQKQLSLNSANYKENVQKRKSLNSGEKLKIERSHNNWKDRRKVQSKVSCNWEKQNQLKIKLRNQQSQQSTLTLNKLNSTCKSKRMGNFTFCQTAGKTFFLNTRLFDNFLPQSYHRKEFIYYVTDFLTEISEREQEDKPEFFIPHMLLFMHVMREYKYKIVPPFPKSPIPASLRHHGSERLIIFDLDETLIHSAYEDEASYYFDQHEIMLENSSNSIYSMFINFRPKLIESLTKLSKHFNLGIFTAASSNYADKILRQIDPNGTLFSLRLFRHHCTPLGQKEMVKDLRVIQNIDLRRTLLIDNCPYSGIFQKRNILPIVPFTNDEKDRELEKLTKYLIQNFSQETCLDFREILHKNFGIQNYGNFSTIKELAKELKNKNI